MLASQHVVDIVGVIHKTPGDGAHSGLPMNKLDDLFPIDAEVLIDLMEPQVRFEMLRARFQNDHVSAPPLIQKSHAVIILWEQN